MINVAIYGGAFDPIHIGHVEAVKLVLRETNLFDEIWILPCYEHSYNKVLTSSEHRLEMCNLAIDGNPKIKICNYEIKHKLDGSSYNLMTKLIKDDFYNDNYNFSMILGMDNSNNFHKFLNYKYLEKLVRFVVIPRKGVVPDPKVDWYLKEPHIYLNSGKDIIECSSTFIRNELETGLSRNVEDYLSQDVLEYIKTNKLYGYKE